MSAVPKDLFALNNVNMEDGESGLTILSSGIGQDSMTILFKIVYDEQFRNKYLSNKNQNGENQSPYENLLVLFADTGEEAPMTYDYLERVMIPFCEKHGIKFVPITNDMGYHGKTWLSLQHQWESGERHTIGSVAYPKTCTHNLKMQPQYRFVEDYLLANYDLVTKNTRKAGYVQFAKVYGKIKWLVGIAKGEERRVADVDKETALWKKQAINVVYPLIEEGLDRQGCQDYIKSVGEEIPYPSNCLFCPYASGDIELLWLYKSYPERFDIWVAAEQKKLDDHAHVEKNLGVKGKLHTKGERKGEPYTLRDALNDALLKYPDITLNELSDYRFSHGHCVVSKF